MLGRAGRADGVSTVVLAPSCPPATATIKPTARSRAMLGNSKSTPRSNLALASVCSPKRLARPAMVKGSKKALSRTMLVVSSLIAERLPPMIPARASTPTSSAMTSSSPDRAMFCSFNNSKVSPFVAKRTQISPVILSASKACSGCPSSNNTKLVTSTKKLCVRSPEVSKRSFSHCGEGIVRSTPRIGCAR